MSERTDPLEHRREEWMSAVNAGDLERYAELVAEDLVWLPPAGEPVVGREAFRAWLEPFFRRYDYDFSVSPRDVQRFDGWCAEVGDFRSVLTEKTGGAPAEHRGRYFVLWRREGGAWRIERYVDGVGADG